MTDLSHSIITVRAVTEALDMALDAATGLDDSRERDQLLDTIETARRQLLDTPDAREAEIDRHRADARTCRRILAQIHALVTGPGPMLPTAPWEGPPVDVLVAVSERMVTRAK